MSTGDVGYFSAKVVRGNIGARRRKLNLANKYKTTLLAFIELRLSCGKFSSLPSCRKSEPSLSVEFDPTTYLKREVSQNIKIFSLVKQNLNLFILNFINDYFNMYFFQLKNMQSLFFSMALKKIKLPDKI